MPEDDYLARLIQLRDDLKEYCRRMDPANRGESGSFRTMSGGTDTTEESIRRACEQIEKLDRIIAQWEAARPENERGETRAKPIIPPG